MPISTLLRGDFQQYFDEEKDRGDLWFFLHIPKTAGSSFRQELADRLTPERNINAGDDNRDILHRDKMEDALNAFLSDPELDRIRFASGHLNMRQVLRIRDARPDTKIITILREPVARLYSDFRYARTPQHPPYAAFIKRFPTLMDYIRAPESANKMFRRLAPPGIRRAQDLIAFLNENLANIGLLETYNNSFYLLSALLGEPSLPSIYERKTVATEHNDTPLTEEHKAVIIQRNALDMELYAYYYERLRDYAPQPAIEAMMSRA